jgi:hypothetical protein
MGMRKGEWSEHTTAIDDEGNWLRSRYPGFGKAEADVHAYCCGHGCEGDGRCI